MGQNADIISQFFQYSTKIMPEIRKQAELVRQKQLLCNRYDRHGLSAIAGQYAHPGLHAVPGQDALQGLFAVPGRDNPFIRESPAEPFTSEMLSCCLFAMCPGTDPKDIISFVLSIFALNGLLEDHRIRKDITEETEVRNLFSCLTSATDPLRSCSCAMLHSVKNSPASAIEISQSDEDAGETNGIIDHTCLSDQCRLQLALLPSYKTVAPKLKKYMQLYVDLQAYRHYPSAISINYLKTWSSNYIRRYPEITEWEFCAAADSFIGIAAMYAAAGKPGTTAEEVALLDEACFPWLSGLSSLLDAAIRARISGNPGTLNFTSFYSNLKECETRVLFFMKKAETACLKLKDSSFYLNFVKIMAGLYLTEPETDFGMLRLACDNIMKKSSFRPHARACSVLRLLRFI